MKKIDDRTRAKVTRLIKEGLSYSEISRRTGVCPTTVKRLKTRLENKEGNYEKYSCEVPENFIEDWNKWTKIIQEAYQSGRIKKSIRFIRM